MPTSTLARVAVPVPVRRTFDFLIPKDSTVSPGVRVLVPFGGRRLVGVVVATGFSSEVPRERLKSVEQVYDREPVVPGRLLETLTWAADYYHHPIGEVMHAALPFDLRRGIATRPRSRDAYRLTAQGAAYDPVLLDRAPAQKRLLQLLQHGSSSPRTAADCRTVSPSWRRAMSALIAKGLASIAQTPTELSPTSDRATPVLLNPAQRAASAQIVAALGRYRSFLLYGITGSGKTEVYLRVVNAAIERRKQALVLVPEIALTPQLIERFQHGSGSSVALFHSGMSAAERYRVWRAAASGGADVVLGTRSAIFVPLLRPGVFIVDEEHDASYKQQDGFRYHARDLALYRAKREGIPVVLGSATPALETLANAERGRHQRLELAARAGAARLPAIRMLDLRTTTAVGGVSRPLLDAMRKRIERGEQSLLFLNRRGYAPVMYCVHCQWCAHCPRCDAKLTCHRSSAQLRCHHCGHTDSMPPNCPHCGRDSLMHLGEGTQRVEQSLRAQFPQAKILRIDRDATRRKGRLEAALQQAKGGEAEILVGTQLLSKGHDFPKVTLVGVINADQGLFSLDFRAAEHLLQQILQVAGRAGRADKHGEVLIQTSCPDHPYFRSLATHDYGEFAQTALAERKQARCPPYRHFALLRAESTASGEALRFLSFARTRALSATRDMPSNGIAVMDPVPAPMEKRAGRYRAQLLLSAGYRPPLHRALERLLRDLEKSPQSRRVRWSLDVDPIDLY